MKKYLLIFCVTIATCSTALASVDTLTGAQFAALINDSTPGGLVLIDLRNISEMSGGAIGTATCKPYNLSWNDGVFRANYTLITDKTLPIALYCASGNRSRLAAKLLDSAGYTRVYHLAGGKGLWNGTTVPSTEILPLSRFPASSYIGSGVVRHHQMVTSQTLSASTVQFNYRSGVVTILHANKRFSLNGSR